ncbi:uncharacterized protein METZ01_LOCUS214545, partial [marine metagenome]
YGGSWRRACSSPGACHTGAFSRRHRGRRTACADHYGRVGAAGRRGLIADAGVLYGSAGVRLPDAATAPAADQTLVGKQDGRPCRELSRRGKSGCCRRGISAVRRL